MWIVRVGSAWALGIFLLGGTASAEQPWVAALGKQTLVCVSPTADAQVQAAAQRVLTAVQAVQPQAALQDPDKLALDYGELGTHHVIAIGQWQDNQVLRMTWGHWANSRQQRQWQARGDQRAMELTDLWNQDVPPQAWRWQHEFFAFGYGDFDGPDVGYVQTVRNPFPLLLRTVPGQTGYNADIPRPYDRATLNEMYFITDLTGTGPAGVIKAVESFLKDGLLNGVLPGSGKPLLDDWSLEGLGPKQLVTDLPAWAPVAKLPADVQYLGQQMPGSHLYGGFCEASGVRPQRMWRLKYRVADGFRFFDSYPTARASGNELLIADCSRAEDAKTAAAALQKSLPPEPRLVTWEYGGHSYAIYGNSFKDWMTWSEAKSSCEKLGGHLITLGSQQEQAALAKAITESGMRPPTVFIGLSGDWKKDQWAWVTGEPVTFRGFRVKSGKEFFGFKNPKGIAVSADKIPDGPHEPVRFTLRPDPGWYVDERGVEAFVCEWDKPGAAPRPSPPRTRVATRGQYVLMQSFDDLAGDAILRKGVGQ